MTLLVLGLLVLLGFVCARACKQLGLPSVTGYLLVGLVMGPSAMRIVGPSMLSAVKPLSTVCLAAIFFLLGEEFRLSELRRLGVRYLALTVTQSLATFGLVAGLLLLLRTPLPIALLMGAIAGTTDPAATLAVIREMRARGELVKALLAVVALNGLVEMALFNTLLPVVELAQHGPAGLTWSAVLQGPLVEMGGSSLLGLVLGVALRAWSLTPQGRDAIKLPTVGLLLFGAGACEALHLSILLVMLVFGAVVANTVPVKTSVFDIAKWLEGPLLVLFFTLAGASLHLAALFSVGAMGLAYVLGRLGGKLVGGGLGAAIAGCPAICRKYLGCGLVPQASMAIGLTMIVQERFPSLAGPILPVSLGAVVVFEVLGPLLTRMAILRAGESPEPQRASRWLDAILPNPRPAP